MTEPIKKHYDIFKGLKDAGFPQEGHDTMDMWLDKWGNLADRDYRKSHDLSDSAALVVRLDDLIEACGDKFESLTRMEDDGRVWWQAYMTDAAFEALGVPCVQECCGYEAGDIPEEAVANLWIALNTKHDPKDFDDPNRTIEVQA